MNHGDSEHNPLFSPTGAAVATAGAVTLSPYVLPAIGIGSGFLAQQAISGLCGNGLVGSGIAGAVQGAFAHVPMIGHLLAAGGLSTALFSGGIGIGGMLLSKWVEKFESPPAKGICLSKAIRWAAVGTSILIALPALLTGLSVGLTFLAGAMGGVVLASHVLTFMSSTLGAIGTASLATSGTGLATLTASHLFTCGAALLPAALTGFFPGGATQRYAVELMPSAPTSIGTPCELTFRLKDTATGHVLTPADLATIHTKKLHTMLVDSTLTDYHHLHPVYDPARGVFTCQFTPQAATPYSMWNDFTVGHASAPMHIKNQLPCRRPYAIPARVTCANHVRAGDLHVDISSSSLLCAGADATLTLTIRDASGKPVTDLEPIMGAYAHLVGFSPDGEHFIHSHPLGIEPTASDAHGSSPLQFHVTLPTDGATKFFLQIQRQGHMATIPFGQMVAPALSHGERVSQAAHHHGAMAIA